MKRLVTAALTLLMLAGCAQSPIADVSKTPLTSASASDNPADLSEYYSQEVTWKECGPHLKCTTLKAPLDYSQPQLGSIDIAVNRYWAGNSEPKGELLINPGGPGASGYDWVKDSVEYLGTKKLKANFAIIGFDPRGVQHSTSVHCLPAKQLDEFFYGDDGTKIGSPQDLANTSQKIQDFAAACENNTGALLGNVDTQSAARDLDLIRAALGQEKLDYLGFSYGTFLGTVYANLFPTNVGRFVLDGAVDPTQSQADVSLNQLVGFDNALQEYLKDCVKHSGCPFKGSLASNLTRIKNFMLAIEGHPLANSDDSSRKVTIWAIESGMMMALYSADYWQYLDQAFSLAFETRNGAMFQRLADAYNDRASDGTYSSNINEANIAINCLDAREDSSDAAMQAQNARMLAASPTLGRYWQYGAMLCANWPYPVKKPLSSFAAVGAPQIVVVGTTNDPATPYAQAVNLAHNVLADGYLITYDGEGHTAYGQGVSCVDNAVDNFFVTGKLPASEPKC